MFKKMLLTTSALLLSSTLVWAQGDPPEPPPDGEMMPPQVILAPPPGTEEPEGVEMPEDPDAAAEMVVEIFHGMMDTDGSGELSLDELRAWVMHVHMPPPPPGGDGCMGGCAGDAGDGCMGGCAGDAGDGCMGGCAGDAGDGCMGGCGGDGGDMGGVSEGDEGLEGAPHPPECSDEVRDNELLPQEENVSCPHSESVGNLLFRTVCNMDGWRDQAISLPPERAADCFAVEAIKGHNIVFEIINEADGAQMFHTSMGKAAFDTLVLTGENIYRINLISADEPDARITVRFIDHAMF